jgi:fructose-bisphosphate aldolase, class I
MADLAAVAKALVAPGKGILAADESTSTIKRRFDAIGVENSEDNRRAYRELLFRTPGIGKYISGVILYDETIRQKASDGTPLVKLLTDQGVMPGIKVDIGAKPLAKSPKETVTEGLDGLRERLAEYAKLGAKFSKWRAVINIEGDEIPSLYSIRANAHALARYAALSQEAGIVPIVEPEVLMDGSHSIDRCYEVSVRTLRTVFNQLASQRVDFDQMLLKPAMVLSGKDAKDRAPAETIARFTLHCFLSAVPAMVPGIVFLSGGQSDDEATVNLDAINRRAADIGGVPWQLTFSYGRGLQAAPQKAWSGKKENVAAAQRAFAHRSRLTSAARQGEYRPEMEKETAAV